MSRIGRMPVTIPAGVEVKLDNGVVTVKGPKGELTQNILGDMGIEIENGVLTVTRPSDDKTHRSMHGLARKLIANMVEGVTNGFTKNLEIVGVGYRASKEGNKLVLNVGYSHPVEVETPDGITLACPSQTEISVKGTDKVAVGQVAANIRAIRLPEPYHGYGIRYKDEVIVRKVGKTGK